MLISVIIRIIQNLLAILMTATATMLRLSIISKVLFAALASAQQESGIANSKHNPQYSSNTDSKIVSAPPPQSQYTPPPAVAAGSLRPVTYTYDFTVTTATTAWAKPSFQTPAPLPACSNDLCPRLDHKVCQDSMGMPYGVLCDTRFAGIIITTSGKRKRSAEDAEQRDLHEAALLDERGGDDMMLEDRELGARTYTGTFDGCVSHCDEFDVSNCLGVSFNAGFAGNCQSLASIDGSFPAPGDVAAVRL